MTEIIPTMYENGMLRPLRPLPFLENQIVWVQLIDEGKEDDWEGLIAMLVEDDIIEPPDTDYGPDPVSREERQRIADLLGNVPGKPLSQIVIEDRGEW